MPAPAPQAPASALVRCIGDVDRFASETWSRRPLHHRGGEGFDDLLSLRDIDLILSTTSLRVPLFRLVKDGATLPSVAYTKRGRTGSTTMTGIADPARVFRLFSEGATIVLQSMHRYWLPLARLCRDLEVALGHPTQVNAYITPPGARGLAVHEDTHDVFVLQSFGRKHWEVYERTTGPPGEGVADRGPPALSVELRPGECLYLPKGTPHAARTQESLSGHLTVGILTTTWGDVLGEVLARLPREPELDEPLPVGYHRDPEGFAQALGDRLEEARRWLDKSDPHEIARGTIRRFLTTRSPLLPGLLEDLTRLPHLDDRSGVSRRPGSICELVVEGDRFTVLLGDRGLSMPAWLGPAMRRIARGDRFRVGDLSPEVPDRDSRLVLVRRLVREGLLEVGG